METYEYLQTKEDKESLETIYNRIFKTAESGEFVNQHLVNASMNLRAAVRDLDGIIAEQPAPPDLQNAEQPEPEKRLLSLTEEEVYMVRSSLSLVYKQKISLAIDNRGILPDTAIDDIFDDANKYDTLAGAIFEGNRDKK